MKILLISKVPPHFEQFRKSADDFPTSQAQYLWKKALLELNHQVEVFRYSDPIYIPIKFHAWVQRGIADTIPQLFSKLQLVKNRLYSLLPTNHVRTQQLIKQINTFTPEVLLIAGGVSELTLHFLKVAKKKNIKIILLHGEDPLVSATSFEKDAISFFDHIVVNDSQHAKNWLKLGARAATALPYSGVDTSYHISSNKPRDIDVVFVGTLLADRQASLKNIVGFEPHIFGFVPPNIGLSNELKPFYKGEAWGKDMVSILGRSKIAINYLPSHMPNGGNIRQFEIPGCGALQLASRCPNEWYAHDKEVVIFSSDKQLVNKVSFYLKEEKQRQKIAQAGEKKTHKIYTYKNRFKAILSL